ncbi:MAG: DUF305 domain-containing protein [Pseudomonadota bacterium]
MQQPKTPASRRMRVIFALMAVLVLAIGLGAYAYQATQKNTNAVSPIDSGFARSMLLHHAQAIQMSMMMRDKASPEIQALAQSIIMKQTREMGVMEGWLTAWNEPVMLAGPPMAWVENATNVRHLDDQLYQAQCKADGGAMAGVATPEQLQQLENATGTEKEILFLELMLAHHRAAIPMAWFANRNGQSSLVKALASGMIRDQGMEIGWIQLKLQQLKKS